MQYNILHFKERQTIFLKWTETMPAGTMENGAFSFFFFFLADLIL